MARFIGIDLGTSSVLVYVSGKGIVLEEPSVVAVNDATGELIEIGKKTPKEKTKKLSGAERAKMIERLTAEMREAARELEFEKAAYIRDQIKELRNQK